MQMSVEFRSNNDIREILEKTYRMVYDQIENTWQYYPQADVQDEKSKRDIQVNGAGGDESRIEKLKEVE